MASHVPQPVAGGKLKIQLINSQLNERSQLTVCTHCAMIKISASAPRVNPLRVPSRSLLWVFFRLLITSHRLAPPHGGADDAAYRGARGKFAVGVTSREVK